MDRAIEDGVQLLHDVVHVNVCIPTSTMPTICNNFFDSEEPKCEGRLSKNSMHLPLNSIEFLYPSPPLYYIPQKISPVHLENRSTARTVWLRGKCPMEPQSRLPRGDSLDQKKKRTHIALTGLTPETGRRPAARRDGI